jgi:hypothetical protein
MVKLDTWSSLIHAMPGFCCPAIALLLLVSEAFLITGDIYIEPADQDYGMEPWHVVERT